jgi:hypothetical protein
MLNKKLSSAVIVFSLTTCAISQAAYAQVTPKLPNEVTIERGIPIVKEAIQTVADTATVIAETITGYPEAFCQMYPWLCGRF